MAETQHRGVKLVQLSVMRYRLHTGTHQASLGCVTGADNVPVQACSAAAPGSNNV